MRVVLQRSKASKVTIDGKVNGKIDKGYVALVGFTDGDNVEIVDKMIKKIVNLRVFEDENEKMNLSIQDIGGSILSISQFTLYADSKKGNRPSFINAAKPEIANELYEKFISFCKEESGLNVETGVFGADMKIDYINDGPITIMLECTKGKIL